MLGQQEIRMLGQQEIFVTVADVTSKSGTSKTNKPYTLYTVTLSDGNTYKTFKNDVATAAQQAKVSGTPVKARVHSEKSSGDFPDDLFIDAIEPAEMPDVVPAHVAEKLRVEANGINQIDTVPARDFPQTAIRGRDEDIRTLFAIKSAVHYVASNGSGDAEKDLTMVAYLAQEFYNLATEGVQGVAESKKELPVW